MSTTFRDRYLRSKYIVQKTIHDYSEKPALRAYLEIFLTLITVSLFGIFAIRPTLITIGRLLQEIKAKESTLTVMNDKVSDLLVAKDLYNREEDKINLIDEAVPKSPKPDNLALQIEELTKKDGVLINNLTIEDTLVLGQGSDPNDNGLNFNLGVTGNYFDLIKFAEHLETMRRPINFDNLTITSNQSPDGNSLFMTFENLSTPYSLQQ
ncbi:MAG: hypothetical protein UT39_C0004G0045 [Candidatus Woesebacteria bacterium GW2011_GWA1_39_21]|uniref:Uncharacterized protein n=1 Tax=Candidatus Woesebacteria bacterium GW2011_GWA1_39_21 TaxID=1618550 RepID=A0A0G0NFW6_9BACT|nr:MAG: hypothetical protein UT39_C0004G0045 [Candidatus Woesebacteria bacterium GW2011_GWA1_39_21]